MTIRELPAGTPIIPTEAIGIEVIPIIADKYTILAKDGKMLVLFRDGRVVDITEGFKNVVYTEILHGIIVPWASRMAKSDAA